MGALAYVWDGDTFRPMRHCIGLARRTFANGRTYLLEARTDRSSQSHRHYWACVQEAFDQLPEGGEFRSSDELRKYALIRTGYVKSKTTFMAGSNGDALAVAAAIRALDAYAFVIVQDEYVQIITAKSQSYEAMGREEFEKSKRAVLDYLADLIGVTSDELSSNAGRSA